MGGRLKYGVGAAGFGKSVGAGFAGNVVGRTVEHGIAAKLHEDPPVMPVRRPPNRGARGPAFTQVLTAGDGASIAGVGLAADAGAKVVREFVPHRKARLHKKK
jgi:hypothetical protein